MSVTFNKTITVNKRWRPANLYYKRQKKKKKKKKKEKKKETLVIISSEEQFHSVRDDHSPDRDIQPSRANVVITAAG